MAEYSRWFNQPGPIDTAVSDFDQKTGGENITVTTTPMCYRCNAAGDVASQECQEYMYDSDVWSLTPPDCSPINEDVDFSNVEVDADGNLIVQSDGTEVNEEDNIVVSNNTVDDNLVDGEEEDSGVATEDDPVIVDADTPIVTDTPVIITPLVDDVAVVETAPIPIPVNEPPVVITNGEGEPEKAGFLTDSKFLMGVVVGIGAYMLLKANKAIK